MTTNRHTTLAVRDRGKLWEKGATIPELDASAQDLAGVIPATADPAQVKAKKDCAQD